MYFPSKVTSVSLSFESQTRTGEFRGVSVTYITKRHRTPVKRYMYRLTLEELPFRPGPRKPPGFVTGRVPYWGSVPNPVRILTTAVNGGVCVLRVYVGVAICLPL